jgi:hypothetical protein
VSPFFLVTEGKKKSRLKEKKMKIGDYILYAKTFHESGRKNIYPG